MLTFARKIGGKREEKKRGKRMFVCWEYFECFQEKERGGGRSVKRGGERRV